MKTSINAIITRGTTLNGEPLAEGTVIPNIDLALFHLFRSQGQARELTEAEESELAEKQAKERAEAIQKAKKGQ